MRRSLLLFSLLIVSLSFAGCGSDAKDKADGGLSLDQQSDKPAKAPPTKEQLLARDLEDMISLLERGKVEAVVNSYIDSYTLAQIKIHDKTFPENKTMQKLYKGFEDGIAPDLIKDLKAAKALQPVVKLEEEGWYSAYYYDEKTMTAELLLGYHPQGERSWFLLEMPLTTPWSKKPDPPKSQWQNWEEAVLGVNTAKGLEALDAGRLTFDAHANPAAVMLGMRQCFVSTKSVQAKALKTYINLLTPDARRIHAMVAMKYVFLSKDAAKQADAFRALLDRYQFERKGFNTNALTNNREVAVYLELSKAFPKGADLAGFIADAFAFYQQATGKPLKFFYAKSAGGGEPAIIDPDTVEMKIRWAEASSSEVLTFPTRFVRIDGKWFSESVWQAGERKR